MLDEEFYPNARPLVIRSGTNKCFSPEDRSQAVRELCNPEPVDAL
ncbi:hypothetical protein A464_plas0116 (plasmid) [Salmonella bongori N268-08]|uniref:Uncharacterized protein n=1 Tax=Salmonella bongori N268-08 TaxID=1197719 RepID=S5NH20_SALBN|nr:hypothetical protein A464_plas0116 [Salmonella bongori N268-08]